GKNKSYATPEQYQGETCRLYRNINGKQFEDVTAKAGVLNESGKSLGVAIADFNNDGWPDMVVSNDTQPNFLYLNNQNGTFRDVGLQAGIAYDEFGRARAGMGIDIADVSNSGRLSIAIGNFSREPISLYTQIDNALFQDHAGAARITRSSLLNLTFGVLFADLDLDGYQDMIVANGHIEPAINSVQQDITFEQSPQVFRNNTKGRFVDITNRMDMRFREPIVARGIATADIDNDGDLDVLMTVNGGAPKLFRNDLPAENSNWIKIKLRGEKPNVQAIGANVTIWAGGVRQQRLVRTGSSYLSQSDITELVFGLGALQKADSVHIRWPTTAKVTKRENIISKKMFLIKEDDP
ncbi:MAG: CRTAC1 family protein, partial [bacterium]